MKRRIKWIDNARGICIFCVLLAHSNTEHLILHQLYTPWFLVLFFFISGFLYKTKSFKDDIFRLLMKLIIPYFLLSTILLVIGFDNWKAAINMNYQFIYEKVKTILLGRHLWFIPCIIMVQLYYILLSHSIMKNSITKICVVFLTLTTIFFIKNNHGYTAPYCSDIALFTLSFFIMGNIFNKIINNREIMTSKFVYYLSKRKTAWGITLLYFLFSYIIQNKVNMEFHLAANYYENPILFIVLAVLGIFPICLVSNTFDLKYFQKLGENSLIAFAFNGKSYAICAIICHICYSNSIFYVILLCFMEGILLLGISYCINQYVPWMVGKQK